MNYYEKLFIGFCLYLTSTVAFAGFISNDLQKNFGQCQRDKIRCEYILTKHNVILLESYNEFFRVGIELIVNAIQSGKDFKIFDNTAETIDDFFQGILVLVASFISFSNLIR